MKANSGYLNWKLQWLHYFIVHNELKFNQILLKVVLQSIFAKWDEKAFISLLRGEIKTEKAICDKLPPWKNLKWVFLRHRDSLSLKQLLWKPIIRSMLLYLENAVRSGFSVYHDCQREVSELPLQTRFESVDVANTHLAFKPCVCLLLNIWKEEQLLNL